MMPVEAMVSTDLFEEERRAPCDLGGWGAGWDLIPVQSGSIQWFRHTGTWWKLRSGVTLARALEFLIEEPLLHPV